MRAQSFLTLAAILVVGAVSGGWRDAPTARAPEGTSLGTLARRNASLDPLTVTLDCRYTFFDKVFCVATASGGSGTGYSFTWGPDTALETVYGGDNFSEAWTHCSGGTPGTTPEVYVTDSDSGFASDYFVWGNCW